MSVRIIIVLLALPLFVLLAAVNSLLLYREETRDMEQDLRGQARAAAVTVAEFARPSPDPFTSLARPGRIAALHAVAGRIPGLDALYLTTVDGRTLNLLPDDIGIPRRAAMPARTMTLASRDEKSGRPQIRAVTPVRSGVMVVADIDAEPLERRTYHLRRLSIALIAGSAALAILLGLIVARRVTREFRRTRTIIESAGIDTGNDAFRISEVRDLADAIRLIDKSAAAELARLQERAGIAVPGASGITTLRENHFRDRSEKVAGARISIRMLPDAGPGSFFAIATGVDGGSITIGQCQDDHPATAFATALAAARYFSADVKADPETARKAFAIIDLARVEWSAGQPAPAQTGTIALHQSARVAAYAACNPDLDPDQMASDLTTLLPEAAIIVALAKA